MKVANIALINARIGPLNLGSVNIATDLVWERQTTGTDSELVIGLDAFLTKGADSYLIGKPAFPLMVVTPEQYGAIGNGVADDTNAFNSMNTAILAAQAAQPNLVVIMDFATNANYVYTSNKWSWGIRRLIIEGNGASIKCNNVGPWHSDMMSWWTNSGVFQNNPVDPLGFLINTVSAGSLSVTLKDATKASKFTVGRWIVVASYAQQTAGWPPNARYFDYAKVTSISGATITFDRPLAHKHRDNWPTRGYSDEIDAARIIPAEQGTPWGEYWIVRNLTALENPNWLGGGVVQIEGFDLLVFENVSFPSWSAGQGRELVFKNSTFAFSEPDKFMTKLRIEGCTGNFSQCSGVDIVEVVNSTCVGVQFMGRRLYVAGTTFSGATVAGPPVQWWDPLSLGGFAPVEHVDVFDSTFDSAGHPSWPALKGTYVIERALGSAGFVLSGSDILVDQSYGTFWDNDGLGNRIYEGQRLRLITSDRSRKGYGDVVSVQSNGAPFTAKITVQWSVAPVVGDIVIQYAIMEIFGVNSPLVNTFVDGAGPNEGVALNIWNGELMKDVWTVSS